MNSIYKLLALLGLLCILPKASYARVVLGDERSEAYAPLLNERRIALFSNHTGIAGDKATGLAVGGGIEVTDSNKCIPFGTTAEGHCVVYGPHILDVLLGQGFDVKLIISPEHGFRGDADAGEKVDSSIDTATGLPIASLYGSRKELAPEQIAMFDVLVVDIQDVGLRYYTYYITLLSLMRSCAANGKSVVLLDRPNPNGFYVDGPILKKGFESGVGALPIPVVHGMTLGELAMMADGEGWLGDGLHCDLTVIKCLGYTHSTRYSLLKAPSPNLKTMNAVYLYASTCFFEGTDVSLGRGTEHPFEMYGAPKFKDAGYGYSFTPHSMEGAKHPMYEGKECFGVSLKELPLEKTRSDGINLEYIVDAYGKSHDKEAFFPKGGRFFNLLMGTDSVKRQIETGQSAVQIKLTWRKELEEFMHLRAKYLLYP